MKKQESHPLSAIIAKASENGANTYLQENVSVSRSKEELINELREKLLTWDREDVLNYIADNHLTAEDLSTPPLLNNPNQDTLLHMLANDLFYYFGLSEENVLSLTRTLLEKGADPLKRNKKGELPLVVRLNSRKSLGSRNTGTDANHEDKVTELLRSKTETDDIKALRKTADVASKSFFSKRKKLAKFLSDDEKRINLQDPATGNTLIHSLLLSKHADSICYVLEKQNLVEKVNPTLTNDVKQNVMHIAAKRGNIRAVRMFIKAGGFVDSKDSFDFSALDYALKGGQTEIVKLMLAHNPDIRVDLKAPCFKGARFSSSIVKLVHEHHRRLDILVSENQKQLFNAIKAGDTERADTLLHTNKRHFDINLRDQNGDSLLHVAIRSQQTDAAKWLIQQGINIALLNNLNATPFTMARQSANQEVLTALNAKRNRALLNAAHINDMATAINLLNEGANVNAQDEKGNTALHIAISKQHTELGRVLFQYKSNPYIRNSEGTTAANLTVTAQNDELAHYLLDFSKEDRWFLAAKAGNLTLMEELLREGVNIDARDQDGNTALHHAISSPQAGILVSFLMNKKADLNLANNDGNTPLHYLVARKDDRLASWFIEKGTPLGLNLDIADKRGNTALHLSLFLKTPTLANVLIKYGANTEINNSQGYSAAYLIGAKKHLSLHSHNDNIPYQTPAAARETSASVANNPRPGFSSIRKASPTVAERNTAIELPPAASGTTVRRDTSPAHVRPLPVPKNKRLLEEKQQLSVAAKQTLGCGQPKAFVQEAKNLSLRENKHQLREEEKQAAQTVAQLM